MESKKLSIQQLFDEATALRNNGKENEAIEKYEEVLKIFEQQGKTKEIAETEHMIGVCYTIKNDSKRALLFLQKAADHFKELKDRVGIGNVYRDIGLTYFNNSDLGQALKWLSKSEFELKKTDDLSAYGITQVKLGAVYIALGQLQQGSIYISKGLANIRKVGSWFNEMTAFMHFAEHRFLKGAFNDMLSFTWAAIGMIFENGEEKEQDRRLAELYALLAWGYVKTESPGFAKTYLEKSENLLSNMSNDVRKVIEKKVKIEELRDQLEA
jgi:tetratricopeptide (TPR) repeat protein